MTRPTRLIDAYQAQNIFIEFFHIRKPQQLAAQRQAFALVPTADAIPISFIEEQVKLCNEIGFRRGEECYMALIEKWREKNGTETD